jgi:hypothetical protein
MFEPNTKMDIKVITDIKDRRAVIIDNFYKNPDEIRELALSLEHNDSLELTGGLPGARGIKDTLEVKEKLKDVYWHLCKNYFGLFNEEKFSENWDNQIFMVNVLNDDSLKESPLGIMPHQDYWESEPGPGFQFAAVVYLNTPDECAGGTNLYSHFGNMSIPNDWQPQWVMNKYDDETGFSDDLDFEYVKSRVDGNNPYTCEFEAKMVYNRMVLYQAEVLHGQNVDLGMFTDYNRINQVLFM